MTAQSGPSLVTHPDTDSMARSLAEEIADLLREAVDRDGAATLIVSGGDTPRRLYDALAGQNVPWAQVTIALADERWVDPASTESNERLVRDVLLTDRASEARFSGLMTGATTPDAAMPACNGAATALKRPFDVVLLGMGEDGHTASLFPGAPELGKALDPRTPDTYMSLHPQGTRGATALPRMTMTLSGILDSRLILLLIAGTAKRTVYDAALAGDDSSAMPVRAVLHQSRAPVQVHWAP